ncbi:hypothetical protein HH308_10410 [Gordonia sp. TBRC 11910]|uniref:Uncharacterized protein n=1 Tax=Gordonia asplenii TaxID=2725283 RepID=A0A848KRN5_9ACTN|nr:DUF4286 family protein [Gordonia asplenii]NMO01624.1 hypothetical protein [Gordonia asplenii]
MAEYQYWVLTNPTTPEQEDEYNEWYDNVHVHDAAAVPGFQSAQRFELAEHQRGEAPFPYKYGAMYEIETDDLAGTIAQLQRRYNTPDMVISEALHPERIGLIFAKRGPRVESKD